MEQGLKGDALTDAVEASFDGSPDPRFKTVMASLVLPCAASTWPTWARPIPCLSWYVGFVESAATSARRTKPRNSTSYTPIRSSTMLAK